ncbi:MAG: p-hydroxycinnamoyl CoA hydratase/lyase [Alphaproteobacteria bacterium]|nr:MAG: p-hydroxycinnamoyl CoA hydratase/lyase [Alphaproteobacteria bacterium]
MTTKKYETVLIEKQDGITWLIMNRPEKRNAMSPQLHIEMDDALADLAVDPQNFRANDDAPAARAKARHASNQWRWQRLSTFPQPTIAMVNGYCFGGGFTQVCACDLAVAADEAIFGLSEVNWGILPGGIVSWNRDAMYYAMTGDLFDGKKAKEIGFVNFSYPKAVLKDETIKLAKKLMEKSPAVLRYTKEALRAVRFMNEPQAADYLNAKSDALKYIDKENSRGEGMKQFLDEKTYRPGFGAFKREKTKRA